MTTEIAAAAWHRTTPPVALAAYAGAGIAGANPFATGNTAFRLGIAKAVVPFVFVYSPALFFVAPGVISMAIGAAGSVRPQAGGSDHGVCGT